MSFCKIFLPFNTGEKNKSEVIIKNIKKGNLQDVEEI